LFLALTAMFITIGQHESFAGAEVCTDCVSRSPQSSLFNYLSQLPIVRDGFARVHNAAIYDDDSRQLIMDLRQRNSNTLNVEERAILRAAAQTGTIGCTAGGSNGTLIRLEDGRDAVITSAHSFIDESGQPRCDLSQVKYLPNVSYHMGGDYEPSTIRVVETNGENPLNLENANRVNGRIHIQNDFLIFILSENISQDVLPDGSTRGFMRIASNIPMRGNSYLIGKNNNFRNGLSHYDSCESVNNGMSYFHICDTTDTSSSSALTQLIDGEMVLTGIHSRAYTSPTAIPRPTTISNGNEGLSMDMVRRYLSEQGRPVITKNNN
jgi:hypothetical protein